MRKTRQPATTTVPSGSGTPAPQGNRAARRAAAHGRAAEPGTESGRLPARRDGRAHTKAAHSRADFAARRSG
ncbi:hypothetical protein GCM10009836_14500 [Pseudonocardia ailaonensis]|uniref:Uncharacterized protein n=1 Tax=Pseudonocardia ailaonensis TaxID=367279 RepID=A0ABN2MSA1_9PSEU